MKLLIVEDEPLLRQRLLRLCRDIVGPSFTAVAVGTLSEAREQRRNRAFDGLLLDLNLAGHDGFGLLREAAAAAMHAVVVSGHGERALEAFELGVLDFVPKPFGRERLALALQRLQGVPAPGARALARGSVACPGCRAGRHPAGPVHRSRAGRQRIASRRRPDRIARQAAGAAATTAAAKFRPLPPDMDRRPERCQGAAQRAGQSQLAGVEERTRSTCRPHLGRLAARVAALAIAASQPLWPSWTVSGVEGR